MTTSFLTKLLFVNIAKADGESLPIDVKLYNPLGEGQTLVKLLDRFFIGLTWVGAFVAPIFIIYGAFQMLTSAGNAEKFEGGKKTILYTVIGFIIILAARGIVDIIKTALTIK